MNATLFFYLVNYLITYECYLVRELYNTAFHKVWNFQLLFPMLGTNQAVTFRQQSYTSCSSTSSTSHGLIMRLIQNLSYTIYYSCELIYIRSTYFLTRKPRVRICSIEPCKGAWRRKWSLLWWYMCIHDAFP